MQLHLLTQDLRSESGGISLLPFAKSRVSSSVLFRAHALTATFLDSALAPLSAP